MFTPLHPNRCISNTVVNDQSPPTEAIKDRPDSRASLVAEDNFGRKTRTFFSYDFYYPKLIFLTGRFFVSQK